MLRPRGFTQYEIRTYVLAQTRSLHIFVHLFPNVNDTNNGLHFPGHKRTEIAEARIWL